MDGFSSSANPDVPPGSLRRIYRSPGPITDPEGNRRDFWRMAPAVWAAGFRPDNVVLNTFSYHLTPGGMMLDSGLRAVGCAVIPGGVGNTAAQIDAACAAGATGYTGTPQFLLTLMERARDTEREVGQVVVTSPNEVYPLVRFGTGDLSAWNREPCCCGRTGVRARGHGGGRAGGAHKGSRKGAGGGGGGGGGARSAP